MNVTINVDSEDLQHIFACIINSADRIGRLKAKDDGLLFEQLVKAENIINHIKKINEGKL
jgi:hypothetical protein